MINVKFLPSNAVVRVPPGSTILQAAVQAGVQVESTCGGKGTCGKCKVRITTGKPGSPSPVEEKLLGADRLAQGWVLACQRSLAQDAVVMLGEAKGEEDRKTGFAGVAQTGPVAPSVRKLSLTVAAPALPDPAADWERLLAALPFDGVAFNRAVAASLPQILRRNNFQVTVVVDGGALVAVEPGDTAGRCFGLAVDIGTTTVVAYLMDLNRGTAVTRGATTNPQGVFGADVISRITYAAGGGLRQLQERVVGGINGIVAGLCRKSGVNPEEIYQTVVVGNTTMTHLFLGIDPSYLAPAPFTPAFQQLVEVTAGELGLDTLPAGKVVVLPNVAGYVGSDTVGVMLAAGADRLEGINLIVDIGTNGEMVLVGKGRILTCSTAAGPAFEGAQIKYGMRAVEGAIEGVRINADVELDVIGGGRASGICGSGLIDAVAEMLGSGIVNPTGRMAAPSAGGLPAALGGRLHGEGAALAFVLARGATDGEDNIALTQKDVREVQLAKGAIMGGIKVLLREMGAGVKDIDRIYLAGAFGNYIKKESAVAIGLLPPLPLTRIVSIGNAAGDGAQMALVSAAQRARAVALARRAEHVELSTRKDFQTEFVGALSFPAP